MSFLTMLNKSATLLRPGPAGEDELKRPIVTFIVAGEAKCRLQRERAQEVPTEAGKTEVADWLAFFQTSAALLRGWHFTVDGVTFRAVAVETVDGATGPHHKEVLARAVG